MTPMFPLCKKKKTKMADEPWLAEIAKKVIERKCPVVASEVVPDGRALTADELKQLDEKHGIRSKEIEGPTTLEWATDERVLEEIAAADSRLAELATRAKELEAAVKKQLDALHEYNEQKDIAQGLMGKIAEWDRVTVSEVHSRFGVSKE